MKRIYIAGPMTGLPEFNYPAFNQAANQLREFGYEVENPAENPEPESKKWEDYLRKAITQMLTCDSVVLLPGWLNSRGARLEVDIAHQLGFKVVDISDLLGDECHEAHHA